MIQDNRATMHRIWPGEGMTTQTEENGIASRGTKLRLVAASLFLGTLINPFSLPAQSYPSKTIRIVTADAGAGIDAVARAISPGLTSSLGQQVIVDNRGGGVIAGEIVANAAPDGYTLLLYGNTLWILPLMQSKVPYDVLRDFAPITLATSGPNILVVHPSLSVRSVKELIVLAKAKPGQLNYASAAFGTANHLAAELFKSMAKVNIVRVPYKGLGAALTDVLSGYVPIVFATATGASPHVHAGRLRALGATSTQRLKAFPQVPTIAEAGLPGYEFTFYNGALAPAATPEPIIRRLNQEFVRALNNPPVKEKLESIGADIATGTPEQFAAKMKSEIAVFGKVLREAGIRAD